jgi:phosphate starvation-inducible protein PhoH
MRRSKHRETTTPKVVEEKRLTVNLNDLKKVKPLTVHQSNFFKVYESGSAAIMMHGVAGTGKTYIALYNALRDVLSGETPQDHVVIVRSAVPSRDIGHLPGDEKTKTEIYTQPYVDICADLFPKQKGYAYRKLEGQGALTFMVTSFVRGLTLDNAIVLVDEAQNMTDMELNSVMTRMGQNTRVIFCGDFRQTDLAKKNDASGLRKFLGIVNHMPTFKLVEFDTTDIVRSALVKEYIIARMNYEDIVEA